MTEFRDQKSWFLGWFLSLFSFSLIIVLIYPGDEIMHSLSDFLNDPLFASVLGEISEQSPGYALWHSIMSGFLGIIFTIFGLLGGVRISMKSISDGTAEIITSFPQSRNTFLLSKIFSLIIYGIILIISWFLPMVIPFKGNSIEIKIIWQLAIWALLFLTLAILIGVVIGNIVGSSGKGSQNSILVTLALYIIQIILNAQKVTLAKTEFWDYDKIITIAGNEQTITVPYTLFNFLTDLNFINWYTPNTVLLGADIEMKYIWLNLISIVLFGLLAFYTYNKKDLIDERGLISIRRGKKRDTKNKEEIIEEYNTYADEQPYVKSKKSVKKSIYTFWIRPLEKRFPYTADLVYSDRRAIMILAVATLILWPFQIALYTGDASADTINAFSGGFVNVFTWGYDLTVYPPFAFWMLAQTIGVHWILLIPMTLRWIRSVPSRDGEDGTGDLIGSLPVRKREIVYQRLLGVFLELIWTCLWMIIWYLFSLAIIESQVGSVITPADPINNVPEVIYIFNNPINTWWVIIAILSQIPFYMFLTSIGVLINLAMKEKGLTYGKALIYILLLLFIIAFAPGNSDFYWLSGVFGMYNPVAIILEETLSIPSYGVFVLTGLAILTLYLIKFYTKNFSWLKQNVKEFYDED